MSKELLWKGYRRPLEDENIVVMSTGGIIWANLPLYLEEVNHSPTGFEWGYLGSGPSQLAYAILRSWEEIVADLDKKYAKIYALKLYQSFKEDVIANIRDDEWTITSEQVRWWHQKHLIEHPDDDISFPLSYDDLEDDDDI
jgi:hypothetical protein